LKYRLFAPQIFTILHEHLWPSLFFPPNPQNPKERTPYQLTIKSPNHWIIKDGNHKNDSAKFPTQLKKNKKAQTIPKNERGFNIRKFSSIKAC
jgi:hypothetical protein